MASSDQNDRIRGAQASPGARQRAQVACGVLEIDLIIAPIVADRDQLQRLAGQRVEGVSNLKSSSFRIG